MIAYDTVIYSYCVPCGRQEVAHGRGGKCLFGPTSYVRAEARVSVPLGGYHRGGEVTLVLPDNRYYSGRPSLSSEAEP